MGGGGPRVSAGGALPGGGAVFFSFVGCWIFIVFASPSLPQLRKVANETRTTAVCPIKSKDGQIVLLGLAAGEAYTAKFWLLDHCHEARLAVAPAGTVFSEFRTSRVSSAQAVVGVSQPANRIMRGTLATRASNSRHLSVAAGRRGRQERSRLSSIFISFSSINNSC